MRPSYAKELTDTICGILKDERFSNVARGIWTLAEEPKPDLSDEMQNNYYVGEDNASEPSA